MDSYLLRLLSYVPGNVARRVLCEERPGSWGERVDATVLVADLSGFTRLSEALGATGREGALFLTDIVNRYFAMLLEHIAFPRGGELTSFGGDGFVLLYTGESHVRAALATAIEIQEAMALFPVVETPVGEFEIALRVGLCSGSVFECVVGPALSREYLIGGRTVERAVAAQQACERGKIAASMHTVDLAGEGLLTSSLREGFVQIDGLDPLPDRVPEVDWADIVTDVDGAARRLEAFVDPAVLPLIRATSQAPTLEPLYCAASAVFIHITGIPFDGKGDLLPALTHLAEAMGAVLLALGLPLRKTDAASEGFKLILIYGPPEGLADHALNAALAAALIRTGLRPQSATSDAPGAGPVLRMGIASGDVYAGEIGSRRRREYTAIGDAMNTAARLCDAARPWEILTTTDIAQAAAGSVPSEPAAPLDLRGKRQRVPCHRLLDPNL